MTDQATLPNLDQMRKAMVASQLRTNTVNDPAVVAAIMAVAREDFLPQGLRAIAYRDTTLPLGDGRVQNTPLATARLISAAEVGPEDHVLLIGAAGGYTAAVLAQLAGSVVAVEESPALLSISRDALGEAGRVTLAEGPLNQGWADGAPYDVILIDGAVEIVPDAIIAQAKPGARIATGLVDRGITRLASGRRSENGFGLAAFADADCAILPGFARPKTFQF